MKRVVRTLVFSSLLALAAFADMAFADDDQTQHHHEDLTTAQLGTVTFPVSCAPDVQKPFERGVALLHSFWYEEAEKEFVQIAADDPHCVMAHWGVAMSLWHQLWNEPDKKVIQHGLDEVHEAKTTDGPVTPREKAYLAAIAAFYGDSKKLNHEARAKAYSAAMKKVYETYPDDHEAAVFYALSLLASEPHEDATFANRKQAAAILEKLFAIEPDHPGVAHYLIHSYDYPGIAAQGLSAARRYSEIAPSAPHALHMPSHIFTRVGAWPDSVASNVRSASAAKAENASVDQLHAMDYLVYADLQLARDLDARRVVEEAPGVQDDEQIRAAPYALAAIPARYALERGAWTEAALLQPRATRFAGAAALTYFARALGAARSGDAAAAEHNVQELARIVDALKAEKDGYWITEVEVQRMGGAAWAAFARGDRNAALDLMTAAADLEDKSEKSAISPGRLVPAHELLGDMLLESGKPAAALAEYERSQLRDPNRFRSLYGAGQAAAQSGDRDRARYYFTKLIDMAGAGKGRAEMEAARRFVTSN